MTRTSIFLSDKQLDKLRKQALDLGINMAELVRRIIDQHFEKKDGK